MGKKFSFEANGVDDIMSEEEAKVAAKPVPKFPKYQLVEIPTYMLDIGSNIRNINANDELDLAELGASIKEHGQLEPCIVYPSGNRYIIKVGSRRFKACLECNIPTVKCIIEDAFKDEIDRIVKQATENEHRKNMSPREREKYMAALVSMGLSQTEIAKLLHKGKSWVSEALRAYEIVEENKDLFSKVSGQPSTRDVYNSGFLPRSTLENVVKKSKTKAAFRKNLKDVMDMKTEAEENGYTEDEINAKLGFSNRNEVPTSRKLKYIVDDTRQILKLCKKDIKDDLDNLLYNQLVEYYKSKGYTLEYL